MPAPKEYEFGWNRGNPEHYISRYEQSKDHRFRTRVGLYRILFMNAFNVLLRFGGETTMEVMGNIIMSITMAHHMRSLTKKWYTKHRKNLLITLNLIMFSTNFSC